jgi:hypothetical protein
VGLTTASGAARTTLGALLALVLAVRLLSPAGFMPAFEHGSVAIVACPDYQLTAAPMAHPHHGDPKKLRQPCPFAAGATAAAPVEAAWFAAALLLVAALSTGRPPALVERHRTRDRPPSRGPPLPA